MYIIRKDIFHTGHFYHVLIILDTQNRNAILTGANSAYVTKYHWNSNYMNYRQLPVYRRKQGRDKLI